MQILVDPGADENENEGGHATWENFISWLYINSHSAMIKDILTGLFATATMIFSNPPLTPPKTLGLGLGLSHLGAEPNVRHLILDSIL